MVGRGFESRTRYGRKPLGSRAGDSGLAIFGAFPLARALLLSPDHGLLASTRSLVPESETR